jgi:hypothetical protein
MCRHVYIRISAEETKAARRLAAVLIPAYASIALLLLTAAMVFDRPPNEQLAAGSIMAGSMAGPVPASQYAQHPR